jgi:hypothetical protein
MTMTYRCTICNRAGRDFAFWWLAPLTPGQRAAAIARGATLADPPLISEPVVMCPACKVAGTVVDEHGQPASHATRGPQPHEQTLVELQAEKAVTRALRAQMAEAGRVRHGAVMTEEAEYANDHA